MRDLIRWLGTAIRTVARELYPGRVPSLRPFPKALLVVAGGLVLAFVLPAAARPAALTEELAVRRLERFAQNSSEAPALLPAGDILTQRPCFRWPAVSGAASYDFRLSWDAGEIRQGRLAEPRYLMRTPGRLERGRAYRYTVVARAADGRPLGEPVSASFAVVEEPPELRELEARARLELEPHDAALVLAGYFAENGSPSDVAAAVAAYVEAVPGEAAPVAGEVLRRLECR